MDKHPCDNCDNGNNEKCKDCKHLEQKIKREKLMRELQKIHFAERCKNLFRR